MSGRILHDGNRVRVVELSAEYSHYSPAMMPVCQTVAVFDDSDWRPDVTLARPESDGVEQFRLSFEELDTLVSAYVQLRHDREAALLAKVATESEHYDLDDLEDLPF